jgi:hypothetical protein
MSLDIYIYYVLIIDKNVYVCDQKDYNAKRKRYQGNSSFELNLFTWKYELIYKIVLHLLEWRR